MSRYPTSDPVDGDQIAESFRRTPSQIAALHQREDLNIKLRDVFDSALNDDVYQQLKSVILNGFPHTKAELPDVLKPFWNIRNDLAFDDNFIMYDCRLFIPTILRNRILLYLHDSHQGIARTKERARLAVYWPAIDRDIETIIGAWKQCQDDLPSLGREPMITHALPERPFQHLAADFAQLEGRNYLIMVDWSGCTRCIVVRWWASPVNSSVARGGGGGGV